MLPLSIAVVGLLALINYRIGGKAPLYPGLVFCGMWTLDFLLVWLAGDLFYRMRPETFFFFICGALAFSAGCWAAMLIPGPKPPARTVFQDSSNRIIGILFFVVVVGTPFFVRWLYQLVTTQGAAASFLMLARVSVMEAAETGHDLTFTLFGTLVELAGIVALLAFYGRERHPKRAVVALVIALGMGTLLGQKVGPLSILIGVIWLDWLKNRRLRWKLVCAMVLIFLAVTVGIEFYVHLGGDSIEEKAAPILQNVTLYASGGMVGFDRLLREPKIVPPSNPLYDSYSRVVKRLGGHIEVPPQSRDFVAIGPHSFQNNVYTLYGEYLFLGYFGALLLTALIGLVITLIYKRALQGGMIAAMLYAVLFRGVMFGAFGDYFLSPYPLFKLCAVAWLAYYSPAWWEWFKALVRGTVKAELVEGQ